MATADIAVSRSGMRGLVFVALAVALISASATLIRFAGGYSPYEITFARMAIASAILAAMARLWGQPAIVSRDRIGRFLVYGLIAALHFVCYIASLSFTTVAHSLALVYTSPLFVTLFAAFLLGESIPRIKLIGVPVAVLGVAVLAGFEPALDSRMIVGDLLAVGSAITFGLYSVAGRHERDRTPLLTYSGSVYLGAAIWSLPLAVLTYTGLPSARGAAAIVVLAIFPLAIGHTLYNASLRRVHPTYVNLVATQEVTGGVLLAALVLGEIPGPTTLLGVALTILGVALVLTLGNRPANRGA